MPPRLDPEDQFTNNRETSLALTGFAPRLTEAQITKQAADTWLRAVDSRYEDTLDNLRSALESSYDVHQDYIEGKRLDVDTVWAEFWAKAKAKHTAHFDRVKEEHYDDLLRRRPRVTPSTEVSVTDASVAVTVQERRDRSNVLRLEGEYKLGMGFEQNTPCEWKKDYDLPRRRR